MIKIENKYCKICGELKSLTEYYSQNKTKKDGTPYIYYHLECKVCAIEKAKLFRKNNPEKEKIYQKTQNLKPEKKKKIKELKRIARERGDQKRWLENNKDKVRKYTQKRNAHKTHEISNEEWENCKNYFNYRCAYCGLAVEDHFRLWYGELKQFDLHKEHVDHNGLNDLSNCVPSCQSCNSSKHVSTLEEWYTPKNPFYSIGRLNKIHNWLHKDVLNVIKA